jgi:hypothetical protein
MAAPFSVTPNIGADFNTITLAADLAAGKVADARLGEQRFGSNGRRYVYAQANGTINASVTVCTVNATTFLATNSGGSYTSPPVAMAAGDRGWFSAASV